ncbi:MAG: glycosyltransferase family 87 protein [Methanomassiliicoccales archaeon]|nr:glycosyltransferase family 87 protein [Methanomassiliicoccales archaeon]
MKTSAFSATISRKTTSLFPLRFGGVRNLLLIILVGLIVRLIVAPWTSCPYDIYPFYKASVDKLAGLGVYGHAYLSYPPLSVIISYPFIAMLSLFLDPSDFGSIQYSMVGVAQTTGMLVPFVTHPLFNLSFKLPLIISDLLLGITLYRFVRERKGKDLAEKVFVLWFLNPLVIWISSVAGQIDVLPAFMTVIALINFYRREYFFAGLALGIGVFLKIYPIYLFIFYLTFLFSREFDSRCVQASLLRLRGFYAMVVGGLISLIAVLPFFLTSDKMLDFIFRRTGSTSYGGLNFWFFVPALPSEGLLPDILPSVIGLPTFVFILMIILIFLVSALIVRQYANKELDELRSMTLGNIAVIALILFLQPVTNPQHMLWIFPMLLIALVDDKRYERKLYLLTVLALLYFIWLQSAYALIYPAAAYSNLVDLEFLNTAIINYYTTAGIFSRESLVIASAMLGGLTILSILLPKKYDFVDRIWNRLVPMKGGRE